MIFQKTKELFKNFYFLFFFSFILWMTIIDTNGFINRYRLSKKLSDLNTEKSFYQEEIEKISDEKKQFENNEELLEKFAREEYLMKKESEDIFYILNE